MNLHASQSAPAGMNIVTVMAKGSTDTLIAQK